jgi:pentatricopeptide repeat protein
MFNKGQGKTMGSYQTLLTALIEDGRVEEAEELFGKIFSRYMEGLPRIFFMKMISLYYSLGSYQKMFEVGKLNILFFSVCKSYRCGFAPFGPTCMEGQ